MKKSLVLSLFAIPLLLVACNNNNKKWEEISRDEAIKLEEQILNNFKAPKFYTSTMNAKFSYDRDWTGEAEAYSEKDKYYKSATADPYEVGSMHVKAYYLRVWEDKLYEFTSDDEVIKPDGHHTRKEKLLSEKETMEILKSTILESYLKTIEAFEECIVTAIECKEKQEEGVEGYEGSYSFYSKDGASLKGEFSYTIPHDDTGEEDETKSGVLQFENNRPKYVKEVFHWEEANDFKELTFNYKKHPNKILDDLKPGEWKK